MQVNTCPGALVVLRPELWVSRSYSTTSRKRCLSVRRLGVGCRAKVPSSGSWNSAGNDLEHGRSKTGWRSNLNRQSIHLIQLQSSYFLWQELRGEQFLVWCCPEGAALLRSRSSWLATWLQFHHTKPIQIPLVEHQIYIQEYINVSWRGKARKPKSMTFNKYLRLHKTGC